MTDLNAPLSHLMAAPAPICLRHRARRGPTFREVILRHEIAYLTYRGRIDNIYASWVKPGVRGVSQLLQVRVNDLGEH